MVTENKNSDPSSNPEKDKPASEEALAIAFTNLSKKLVIFGENTNQDENERLLKPDNLGYGEEAHRFSLAIPSQVLEQHGFEDATAEATFTEAHMSVSAEAAISDMLILRIKMDRQERSYGIGVIGFGQDRAFQGYVHIGFDTLRRDEEETEGDDIDFEYLYEVRKAEAAQHGGWREVTAKDIKLITELVDESIVA